MAEFLNPDGLVLSDHYAETMNGTVLPFLKARRQACPVTGAGGCQLACDRFDAPSPRGTVLVLHGFTECAEKFSEIIFSLLRNGYSVAAYDQRGHGRSGRDPRITDPSLTHVDRFQDYVGDLEAVRDQVLRRMPKPWYLFAHSMGGAVSLLFLEAHPEDFAKAAFCAPMIAPQRGGIPLAVGEAMCMAAKCLGQGRKRIPMSRPWSGPEEFETSCATGRERFDWYDALRVATEAYHNNGPTYSWTLEGFRVTKRLLAPGQPEKVKLPVRIYTAADDNQVIPEAQEAMTRRLPMAERRVVAGAKHEIYRSPDGVLFPWWREILDFFAEE